MAYEPYATPDYYRQEYCGKIVPEDELEKALRQASRHIDSLTYNRIAGRGFSNLTSFQQELIRDVVCQQADFETENADEISTSGLQHQWRIHAVWQFLECFHRQGSGNETRCVCHAVSDGPVLPFSEVRR